MIEDSQLRKSNRTHVVNPMYTEGIEELRKDAQIRYRKKYRNSPHLAPKIKKDPSASQQQMNEFTIQRNLAKEDKEPILCILPNQRTLKIQIITKTAPATPKQVPIHEENPVRKHSTDLLAIFEQVIKEAGYDCPSDQENKVQSDEKQEQNEIKENKEIDDGMQEGELQNKQKIENEICNCDQKHSQLNGNVISKKEQVKELADEKQNENKQNSEQKQEKPKQSYEMIQGSNIEVPQN